MKVEDGALLHFSEDPHIRVFVPRPHPSEADERTYVWAIDADHAPNYLFPRDCPRICIALGSTTTVADEAHFFADTSASRIISVESCWLSTIRATRLYAYHLPAATFHAYDKAAGYFVSLIAVTPLDIQPLGDLIDALLDHGVELRLTPSLWPLQRAVAASSLQFSMIRLRNAQPESA